MIRANVLSILQDAKLSKFVFADVGCDRESLNFLNQVGRVQKINALCCIRCATHTQPCMHACIRIGKVVFILYIKFCGAWKWPIACAYTAKTDRCMSLEIDNRTLVFQKTSALLLISSDMHLSVFAV